MNKKLTRLKITYWIGAVVDLLFAIAMVSPKLWGTVFRINCFDPDMRYRIDMAVGASLMLGWTCLLLWGSFKPVERRGVLLLTVIPVLSGITLASTLAVVTGTTGISSMIPIFAMKICLVVIFLSAYRTARIVS